MFKKRTTKLVETVLASSDRAKQDDKYLMLRVWAMQGLPISEQFMVKFLGRDIASPESIRRTRQKLQAEGKWLPPKPVQAVRRELAESTRHEVVQERLI